MSRTQGFARGDFDTSFPLDDKFLELRGSLDALHYYAAVGVYFTVIAAAWREADRKPGARTAPDAKDQLADLVRVGLLDSRESLKVSSFRRWLGPALASRKSDSDRKARNRAGMSRGTPAESNGVPRESEGSRAQVSGREGKDRDGTGTAYVEGGPGGDQEADGRVDIEAWLLAKFRAPTPAQRKFLDDYCRVFDATGPKRAERVILSHPDDPIAALKADLTEFRAERRQAADQAEEPKPKRRAPTLTGVNAEIRALFREQEEEREQARLERMAEAQA